MIKSTAKKVTKAEEHPSVFRFLPPWLLVPAVMFVGNLLHDKLGSRLPDAPIAVLFVALSGAALSVVTWRYALPRGPVIQWHSTTTTAVTTAVLDMLIIFGVTNLTFWLTVGIGVTFAISWNIRRLEAIKGEGEDANNQSTLTELGLKKPRQTKVIEASDQRTAVAIKLGPGQVAGDVQKVKDSLASYISAEKPVVRGSARAIPGEYEGEVTYSVSHIDQLKETIPYPGPEFPPSKGRASIADGLRFGVYEDGQPQKIWPAGNYKLNIAPGVTAIGGMTRSGKGEAVIDIVAELCTRRDVVMTLSDTRKAEQFLGQVREAVRLYFDTPAGVKAYLRGLERAGTDRNRAIGAAGYKAWGPECYTDKVTPNGQPGLRMPAMASFLEESAAVLDNNATLIVELGEFLLSAGIFLFVSQQRWTHDRAPTSFRSSIGTAICFGTQGDADAGCIIDDDVLASGPNPSQWKNYHPGRNLVTGAGIDPQLFPVPGKAYYGGVAARAVIREWGPQMAELDPVTVAALGDKVMACVPPPAPGALTAGPPRDQPEPAHDEVEGDVDADDLDDDEPEYEPTEEEAAMFAIPSSGDTELDAEMRASDPRAEVPEWAGEDIDLTPEDDGMPELDRAGKFAAFGRVLEDFMKAGRYEVTTSELREAYVEFVGESNALKGDWFLHEMITDYIDGAHQGQMERGHRGKYRLVSLASVG